MRAQVDAPWGLWECEGQGAWAESELAYGEAPGRQQPAVPAGQLCLDRTVLSITLGFMGKVGVRRGEEDWTGA